VAHEKERTNSDRNKRSDAHSRLKRIIGPPEKERGGIKPGKKRKARAERGTGPAGLTDRFFCFSPLFFKFFRQKVEQNLSLFWIKIEQTLIIIGSIILESKSEIPMRIEWKPK
jgi:hypothetical protein